MANLELGLDVVGVEEAMRDLEKVKRAQDNVGTSAEQSNRKATNSAKSAGDALKGAAQSGDTFSNAINSAAGRVQGATGAFASLANTIGGSGAGGALSLVSTMAGAVTQTAQLGAALGPAGAIVGGLTGALIPAISRFIGAADEQIEAHRAAGEAADAEATRLEALTRTIDEQRRARENMMRLRSGNFRSADEAESTLRSSEEIARFRQQDIADLDRMIERLETAGMATETLRQRRADLAAQGFVAESQAGVAEEALQGFTQTDIRVAGNEARHRGAGAARRRAEEEREAAERSWLEDVRAAGAEEERAAAERERRLTELLTRDSGAGFADGGRDGTQLDLGTWLDGVAETGFLDIISGLPEESEEYIRAIREMAEAHAELTEKATEAQTAFADGYINSIDQVVERWRDANEAIRRAGGQINSTARLMERAMVAVGNNIAETIGGTMQGAFQDALGAWLDGSKSFVEAAEDMAKGVIKALTIESIVQAVTEVARAVASFASQDYASGVAHLAAAAAWGAVGVVAGGVGAAVGAFGGGGGDKGAAQGADNRDLSSQSVRERDVSQPLVVNVYPEVFANRNAQRFVYNTIDAGARNGRTIDSRALRGMGR